MSQAPSASSSSPSVDIRERSSEVRVVLLGWCVWLLVSWAVTLTISSTVPAVRGMVMMSLLGLMAIWPSVRLSQATTWRGAPGLTASETLLEWVCLLLVFQAVLWPLRLTGEWPMIQAWSLDAAVAGWSLGTALIIGWGRVSNHAGRRVAAMVACLALLLAEPIVVAAVSGTWRLVISPLETVWRLTAPAEYYVAGPWPTRGVAALAAGVAVWLGAAVLLRLRRPADHDGR